MSVWWRQFNLCLIAALFCALAGCAGIQEAPRTALDDDPWGSIQIEAGSPILIGVAISEDDPDLGAEALEQIRGVQLAVQSFNGISGFTIKLEMGSGSCVEDGATMAETFANNSAIAAVVGPSCEIGCAAAAKELDNHHLMFASPSCTRNESSSNGGPLLTVMPSTNLEGSLAAEFAYSQIGARRAAIISYGDLETDESVAAFRARMEQVGASIVAERLISHRLVGYKQLLEELLFSKPDVLYAPLLTEDAIELMRQLREIDTSLPVIGGRHFISNEFIEVLPDLSDSVLAVGPMPASSNFYRNIMDEYIMAFEESPHGSSHAYSYDATLILLEAIQRVAIVDSRGTMVIGRKALRDAVYLTSNYSGATGLLTCAQWGDCSASKMGVVRVRNREWELVFIP